MTTRTEDLERAVRELGAGLWWALDLLDKYDGRLVQLGDPPHLVNSAVHVAGKAKARETLARARALSPFEMDGTPSPEFKTCGNCGTKYVGPVCHGPGDAKGCHPVDRSARTTTDGAPPAPGHESASAPQPPGPNGQHGAYWVLTAEERAKGFVRPVRRSYCHVGAPGPKHPLRDLTAEELERHGRFGYVKFEAYPPDPASSVTGRFWTQAQLDAIGKGCRTVTTMGLAIAETYARDPGFYGSTFCCACRTHLPVGEAGEFVWDGTDERVGT